MAVAADADDAGFTWEHDLHLYHRCGWANQVLFGDPFSHHERLAAEAGSPAGEMSFAAAFRRPV
jgi:hypothetical protein